MNYHAYAEGFSGNFPTVAALKAWAEDLIAHGRLVKGDVVKVHKADWVAKDGSGYFYAAGNKEYRIVVGV